MNIFLVLAGAFGLLLICSLLILRRNDKVYDYRIRLLYTIEIADLNDIRNGNFEVAWRLDVFRSVPYDEMLYRFWKPLDSFYKGKFDPPLSSDI